jgi:hypothetical protein
MPIRNIDRSRSEEEAVASQTEAMTDQKRLVLDANILLRAVFGVRVIYLAGQLLTRELNADSMLTLRHIYLRGELLLRFDPEVVVNVVQLLVFDGEAVRAELRSVREDYADVLGSLISTFARIS